MNIRIKTCLLHISLFVFSGSGAMAQKYKPEDFGYRIVKMPYKKDTVDLVIHSKKGEEALRKPVMLLEKGSLPIPLLIEYEGQGFASIMPFDTRILTKDYHVVFVSKPGVPAIVNFKNITNRGEYTDPKTGLFPAKYQELNHIDYYVDRDAKVLKFLKKQPWVDSKKMVIAGHSEGGTIVAKLARISKDVTHVISSSANPFGQMATMIHQCRPYDDSTKTYTNDTFEYWEKLVNKSPDLPVHPGFTLEQQYRYELSANQPSFDNFQQIKVPVLVTYGTKDHCAPYNDFMRIAMIRDKKKNFTFKDYVGLEHNYFKVDAKGEGIPDRGTGWTQTAKDWIAWLEKN
ncbi:dienelactone hydrolase family protein [Adhaeribacter sp. BT258]|uniref:Dienelactone hydrolase family protein n=1 Tax=Adhaeribacter terrigena TaxID=2793070 RepID=A0ABS1BX65_9BACT|nr:prolyl oligopeptidase family serine peptidase [Adhaeribacter terrigena]MBK0401741.1 dienelactone hydrolase family protein [Adhaeribacter terrigena]